MTPEKYREIECDIRELRYDRYDEVFSKLEGFTKDARGMEKEQQQLSLVFGNYNSILWDERAGILNTENRDIGHSKIRVALQGLLNDVRKRLSEHATLDPLEAKRPIDPDLCEMDHDTLLEEFELGRRDEMKKVFIVPYSGVFHFPIAATIHLNRHLFAGKPSHGYLLPTTNLEYKNLEALTSEAAVLKDFQMKFSLTPGDPIPYALLGIELTSTVFPDDFWKFLSACVSLSKRDDFPYVLLVVDSKLFKSEDSPVSDLPVSRSIFQRLFRQKPPPPMGIKHKIRDAGAAYLSSLTKVVFDDVAKNTKVKAVLKATVIREYESDFPMDFQLAYEKIYKLLNA